MTEVLATAWADIRTRNPDVPDATIALASGPAGSTCSSVLWSQSPVLLAAIPEGSKAQEVLAWLLHHAAHGLTAEPSVTLPADLPAMMSVPQAAEALGVSRATAYRLFPDGGQHGREITRQDVLNAAQARRIPGLTQTSEGRYHSATYRDAAQQLGLNVARDNNPALGWKTTTMPTALATDYRPTLKNLTAALRNWKPPAPAARPTGRDNRNGLAAYCQCSPARRIRITESVLTLGPIRCEICKEPFEPKEYQGGREH